MLLPPPDRTPSLGAIIRRDWKNPPNLVTTARMVGALWLPRLIASPAPRKRLAGLGLFTALAATDKLDGWMAKEIYGTTELGKMLDPAVDKELVVVTLSSLLADAHQRNDRGLTGALCVALPVLLTREASVIRLKIEAQQRSNTIDSALQSGRVSMVLQSVAIGGMLIPSSTPAATKGKIVLLAVAVGASLYSWGDYLRKYQ